MAHAQLDDFVHLVFVKTLLLQAKECALKIGLQWLMKGCGKLLILQIYPFFGQRTLLCDTG